MYHVRHCVTMISPLCWWYCSSLLHLSWWLFMTAYLSATCSSSWIDSYGQWSNTRWLDIQWWMLQLGSSGSREVGGPINFLQHAAIFSLHSLSLLCIPLSQCFYHQYDFLYYTTVYTTRNGLETLSPVCNITACDIRVAALSASVHTSCISSLVQHR